MQQKVQFVAAVVHDPELADSWTNRSAASIRSIRNYWKKSSGTFGPAARTILLSTHQMDQGPERLCDRVCLISSARKVVDSDLEELRNRGITPDW